VLKNDKWIIEQAQAGMISPFEAQQVRQIEMEGRSFPAISFGVSSYGYDIRLSPTEFLVFKHIPGTVVNPKAFNPGNLEPVPLHTDDYGSYFIIPANSYGLGVSLESIAMPPTITAVCVGKSTYARCFRGDTRVALVDGSSVPLEDMAQRYENGERFWGYSLNELGRVIVTALDAPRYIGTDSLIEIVLDNGESIFTTPDHTFITRDGRYVIADSLRPGDSLMPLYRQVERGYEMVYQPLNGQLHPTHRLADEWNIRNGIYSDTPHTHRHHVDHNRRFPEVIAAFRGLKPGQNHKVTEIRSVAGTHDVYCLTVPEAGNFGLEAGIFVQNCGLIVNVTPLEAGWIGEGITLEFSNSSSADCRVYANEGVAQLLFLEGEPCLTTYQARQGKYQNQSKRVTLAKI